MKVLEVVKLGEKLKQELRHSFLSNGRQESVAEHTWRVGLMAVLLTPYVQKEVDVAKLLKMIVIHDLVEAFAGDVPAFDTMHDAAAKEQKIEREMASIDRIRDMLGGALGEEVRALWLEFEHKETTEAKVGHALDKLEAQIQHNEADIETWLPIEHEMSFRMQPHVEFDETLTLFKELIEEEAEQKLTAAGIDTEPLKQRAKR
ncbi:HD domain-containing protein [Paenalkalicoccus suaedae]|uniref:HD domain-containing protein n=2 Tax=Paenalkalicoccus suaedae TaxID=2592382 RepID=A0A859FKQ1_9BACI|nr:HD domain-containing protein [Paenalkalicoccus suaedae]QKS73362.1 HD domain-containing protein [Paenalkalicoccus suaedae]